VERGSGVARGRGIRNPLESSDVWRASHHRGGGDPEAAPGGTGEWPISLWSWVSPKKGKKVGTADLKKRREGLRKNISSLRGVPLKGESVIEELRREKRAFRKLWDGGEVIPRHQVENYKLPA